MLPPKALREAPSSLLQLLVPPGILGVLGLCGHLPSLCSVVTLHMDVFSLCFCLWVCSAGFERTLVTLD